MCREGGVGDGFGRGHVSTNRFERSTVRLGKKRDDQIKMSGYQGLIRLKGDASNTGKERTGWEREDEKLYI